jgi:predicted  nucleic acid-binding Zn-ribbon protein
MNNSVLIGNKNQVRRMLLIFENIGADKASKTHWDFRSISYVCDGDYNILIMHLFDMENKEMQVEIYKDGSYKYIY